VLKRGYALVTRQANGRLVTTTHMVTSGEALQVRVSDGTFGAHVVDHPCEYSETSIKR
jgi:exonuclease VII large subunit